MTRAAGFRDLSGSKEKEMKTQILKIKFAIALYAFCAFVLPFYVQAQNAVKAKVVLPATVENYKLNSKLMAREMPYRVVVPVSYKNSREKTAYPVIYLLHGLTGHFDNWGDKTKIAEYLAPYNFIVVMPEGNNGWYTDSASVPNNRYETYITQELIPEIDKKFRTLPVRKHRAVAGLSMGGYGSIKFGLKNPESFALVGSFSGALGAASWTEKSLGNGWKTLTDSITSVYGAAESKTRQENDIFKLVKEIPSEKVSRLPFLYLDCGTEDSLISSNRDFAGLLLEKKVRHEFRQLPGKHDWKYWESQIQEFFELSEKFLK
ncbi:MAG: esterase family protein [Acidobacteriota bacterium]|nr:esterase family protein [Acidobacteriota bacterium]